MLIQQKLILGARLSDLLWVPTVPDLEALSLVPPGKCYLPEMSQIFKVSAPELG